MMRKIIFLWLYLLLSLSGLSGVSALAQTLTVGSATITTGDQATIDVNFSNDGSDSVAGLFSLITYDTTAVSVTSCSNCTEISPGTIEVVDFMLSEPVPSGVIASIQFQSQPGFIGTTDLPVSSIGCNQGDESPVPCSASPGSITINPAAPNGSLAPTSLSFNADPDQIAPAQTVTLTNQASASADLTVQSAALSIDSGNGSFTISGGTCDPGITLAPGASCTIDITFQGASTGPDTTSGVLTVNTDDPNLGTVSLAGTTNLTEPSGSLSPASLTFAAEPDQTTLAQTLTLTNQASASADLTLSSSTINVAGGNGVFAISGGTCDPGITLAPGDFCTIDITFQGAMTPPDSTSGTLILNTNDPNLGNASLIGSTVTPPSDPPTLSPSTIDFDSVQVITSSSRSFTVTNTSAFEDLQILDTIITGNGFSISSNDCSILAPGASCTVNITFTPESAAAVSGSLTLSYCFLDSSGSCATTPLQLRGAMIGQGFVPTATITSNDPDAAEAGLDPGSFTITLDQATAATLTINYTVAGSATSGEDYQALSGTATIAANQQEATVTVIPLDDALVETEETVDVSLQPGSRYNIGTPGAATVRIVSDDEEFEEPTVTISTIRNAEEQGTISGRFRISLSEASSQPIQISYVVDGTATAVADYDVLPGRLTIPAGQLSASISVDPIDDEEVEDNETVLVTMISISPDSAGYVFGNSTRARLRIVDNDSDVSLPQVSINAAGDAAEDGLVNGSFNVILAPPAPQGGVTVSYSVSGSATAGLDYQTLSGTLTLGSGQSSASISVIPLSDSEIEGDESVELTLLSNASYQIDPAAREAGIVITDFVEALPQVSVNTLSNASETDLVNGAFQITLNTPAPETGLNVFYNVDGSASAGLDYQTLSGTVTLLAGQSSTTIPVVPLSDSEIEDSETVQLTLLANASYSIDADARQAQLTIADLIISDTPLSDLPGLTPPQKEIAITVENLCRNRSASDNFLRDCDALIAAAVNGDPDVINALGQITPTDVSTAVDIAETSVQTQLQNIRTRLFTLRRKRTGIDVDDLHLDFDAWVLSGKHLRMLAEQGGAAGDEDSSDARAQREPSRLGIFISGSIGLGESESSENQDGFEFNTYGLTAGLDYRFSDKLVAGAALTYATNNTDIDNRGGNLDSDGYAITLYGSYYLSEQIYLDGSLSYGRYDYDQERNLRYQLDGVDVDQTFDADYQGEQFAIDIGGGYQFVRDQLLFGPTARVSYVESIVDGFSERARNDNPGSAWAVQVEEQKQRSLTLSVGAEATYVIPQSWGSLAPQLDIEWVHEFLGDDTVVNGRFVEGNGDATENQFQLPTDDLDSNYFSLGAGLSAQWDVGASAFIQYRTVLGYDRLTDHAVNAGFRWEF